MTPELKLTKKQKEIILALYDGSGKFSYSRAMTRFEYNGKTYPYPQGSALAYQSGLVQLIDPKQSVKYYTLTDKGRVWAKRLKSLKSKS